MMWLRLAIVWVGFAVSVVPAAAEMYRCTLPDGTVKFSGDPSSCRGYATPHEPSGNVQTLDVAPIVVRPPPAPIPAAPAPDGPEQMWRRKRVDAERELGALESGIEEFRQLVSWCNRGGELNVEDEYGLRQEYSCDDARVTHDRMSGRIDELQLYLDGGLDEECRRSGCLPGWIR
jgi:hypothetical protein